MDEGTPAALVATSNYEGIVRSAMTRHAWTFATETGNLSLTGPVTLGNYVWSWSYPPEILNVRWVMVNGRRLRSREYVIQGRAILTLSAYDSTTTPQVVGTIRAPENLWPDDFAEAIVTRLEGLFIGSLADKWQDGRLKIKDAEAMMQAVIVRDKRQQPAAPQEYNRLGETWRVRGRQGHYSG